MTTQNVFQRTIGWTNLGIATHYAPHAVGAIVAGFPGFSATSANAYIDCDGFDHLSIMFRIVSGVGCTSTLTIESDDGTAATFEWDETLGSYDSTTNTFSATYVALAGNTTRGHLHLDDCNGKRFHIKLVIADAALNSGVLVIRATKV